MKLKINKAEAAVSNQGGGNYINESGIYDVTIQFASLEESKNGATSVNFNLDYAGNSTTIYGTYITDRSGNPLSIGMGLINNLGVIAGLEDGEELSIEEETHAVGKDNKEQEFNVITDFSDLPVKARIQLEYSMYNDDIQERRVIRSFYREDGASADEIVNGTEIGVQIEKDRAYASNITYRDDITPEDVEAWKKAKKGGSKSPSPKSTPKAKPKATAARPKWGK